MNVANNSDDCNPRGILLISAQLESPANRVFAGPGVPRHGLIYEGNHWSCCAVSSVEQPALDEIHANGAHVIWADDARVGNEQLSARRLGMSLDRDSCRSTWIRQRYPSGVPGNDHAGKATHARQDLRKKGSTPREIAVLRTRQWRPHHQDMIGAETGIQLH